VKAVVDTNVVACYSLGTEQFIEEVRQFWRTVEDACAPTHWEAELANPVWMAVRTGVLPTGLSLFTSSGPVQAGETIRHEKKNRKQQHDVSEPSSHHANVRSTTQRHRPKPLPCDVRRIASNGRMPRVRNPCRIPAAS
jgi:hypothetical protein